MTTWQTVQQQEIKCIFGLAAERFVWTETHLVPQDARTSIMYLGTKSLRSNQDVHKEPRLFMRKKNPFQNPAEIIFPSKSSFTLFKKSFFQRTAFLSTLVQLYCHTQGKLLAGWMKGPVEFHTVRKSNLTIHSIVYLFPTFHKTVQNIENCIIKRWFYAAYETKLHCG